MGSQRSLQSLGAGATRSVGATLGDVRGTGAPRTVAARRSDVRLTSEVRLTRTLALERTPLAGIRLVMSFPCPARAVAA